MKRKDSEKGKLVSGLKAIAATDLGKIFSAVLVFLVVFLLIPLIYPLTDPLTEMLGSILLGGGASGDLGTFMLTLVFFILLLMFMIFLFGFLLGLVLLKLAFWINKRIAPPLRRSNVQHYSKYVAIIVGIILAFYFMGLFWDLFTEGLSVTLSGVEFLVPIFTATVLACIVFMTLFIGTIYLCIFVNDFLFYIYRKAAHKTVEYIPPEARAIRHRHRAGLGVLMIILIVSIVVWGFFLLNTKPTTLHITQRSDEITVIGATKDQIRVRSFTVIVGSLTPLEAQGLLEGGFPASLEEIIGGMIYLVPPPLFGSSGYLDHYSFDHAFSLPRGQNIMAFSLTVYINLGTDSGYFDAYFYPTAGFECGALSKDVALSAVTVLVDGSGHIEGFTFEVSLGDQFYWSDLLNFGW